MSLPAPTPAPAPVTTKTFCLYTVSSSGQLTEMKSQNSVGLLAWLLPLSMFSRFIHEVAGASVPFLFMAEP